MERFKILFEKYGWLLYVASFFILVWLGSTFWPDGIDTKPIEEAPTIESHSLYHNEMMNDYYWEYKADFWSQLDGLDWR